MFRRLFLDLDKADSRMKIYSVRTTRALRSGVLRRGGALVARLEQRFDCYFVDSISFAIVVCLSTRGRVVFVRRQ